MPFEHFFLCVRQCCPAYTSLPTCLSFYLVVPFIFYASGFYWPSVCEISFWSFCPLISHIPILRKKHAAINHINHTRKKGSFTCLLPYHFFCKLCADICKIDIRNTWYRQNSYSLEALFSFSERALFVHTIFMLALEAICKPLLSFRIKQSWKLLKQRFGASSIR